MTSATGRGRGGRAACLLGAAAAALALAMAGAGAAAQAAPPSPPPSPNIVVFMTDDQAAHTVNPQTMPRLHRLLVRPGTSFSDFIAPTPLCCPFRATLLTGQYGHNNGVLANDYALLREKHNVLPRWLRRHGYETARVGKFFNGYSSFAATPETPAPGWNRWFAQLAPRRYYDWSASRNGKRVHYGWRAKHHATRVTTRIASRWAGKMASERQRPFYLQVDFFAPHSGAGRTRACRGAPEPLPRDEGRFANAALPVPPSFDEEDVSDKPWFVQGLPRFTPEVIDGLARRYRCTLESIFGVDRAVRRVYRAIERRGQLDRTIFLFTPDNGFYFGEHRFPRGKHEAYEENLRLPLAVRIPPAYLGGEPGPGVVDVPVASIDLAPTILDLAGADPCVRADRCRTLDGRSLLPLLAGSGRFPEDRSFLIQRGDCHYRGIRNDRRVYLEHSARVRGSDPPECELRDREHYDVGADPYQLDNLFPAEPDSEAAAFQEWAAEEMERLSACAGVAGRDPRPPSGEHCD